MKLPRGLFYPIRALAMRASQRDPDFIIGGDDSKGAYLLRWFLPITPWRRWRGVAGDIARRFLPSAYLHCFLRDDDDRALHDHPSFAFSLILYGAYFEKTGLTKETRRTGLFSAGSFRYLPARRPHRIELVNGHACWTLFIFGPSFRSWGFWCSPTRWVHWKEFTKKDHPGERGRGCD